MFDRLRKRLGNRIRRYRACGRRTRKRSLRHLERLESRRLLALDFAVIGRYGADSTNQANVAAMVKSWDPDFIVTIGDNNYPSGEAATIDANIGKYYGEYIGDYQGIYGTGSEVNRFFPALGNHDGYGPAGIQPYLDYFTLPGADIQGNTSGNERYYNFVQGNTEFFVINNVPQLEPDGVSASSVQGLWLRNALAESTSAWQFVVAHKRPWSDPIWDWPFAAWGADAVFSESGGFERHLFDGIPYFGNGAGGKSPPSRGHGAQRVIVENNSATFLFYEASDPLAPIDSYTIAFGPEIQVSESGRLIADGTSVLDLSTTTGLAQSRTFTVDNIGTDDLVLSEPITVSGGFSLLSGFGSTVLSPGESTSFEIGIDALTEGNFAGGISFGSNDSDEDPFDIQLTASVTPPPTSQIVDNGDPGVVSTGNWRVSTWGGSYYEDNFLVVSGSGKYVDYAFNVLPGEYVVSSTWVPYESRTSSSLVTIFDGVSSVATATVNQKLAPVPDHVEGGVAFEDLVNSVFIEGSTLVVRLESTSSSSMTADAIRIERIGDLPSGPEIQVSESGGLIADGTSVLDLSTTTGLAQSRTFTVDNIGTDDLVLSEPITVSGGVLTALRLRFNGVVTGREHLL